MSTPNYDIDYNDKRFTEVKAEENAAIKESGAMYDSMISNSDKYFQDQIDASKEYAETQKKNQQAATDFAIEEINQQKAQAKKDYTKEQSGAYVDWQKQSGKYGANAEQMAATGLDNSGFSESSQVSMYNTYQNRVVAARDAYQRAVLNYDNAITEARLQNNSALAEIAYNALQQQLELSLQGFQYKNTLLLDKADKKLALKQMYHQQWQDVLAQINHENSLAEQVRQYETSLAEQKRQYNATLAENKRQHNEQMALQREQFEWQKAKAAGSSSGSSGGSGSIKKSSSSGSSSKSTSGKKTISKSETQAIDAALTGKKSPKSESVSVDMSSVLSLGYGPISASKLNSLISQGIVEEYKEGGKLKYRKVFKR